MRDVLRRDAALFLSRGGGLLHAPGPASSVGVAAEQIGQEGRPLVEPGAFFVDGSYGLRINSWNSLAGVIVTVRMRFLGTDGRIRDNEWTHTPNTNRTKATSDFPLGVGFPLNVTAFVSTGAPLVGQTFVQVQIISGLGGATTLLGTLLQDYLTSVQALAFPGSPIRSSIEGGGYPRTINGTQPGVGLEIQETVPTGARWQLQGFEAPLATSATVAARAPQLELISSGSIIGLGVNANTLAASLTGIFAFAPGYLMSTYAGFLYFTAPIPKELDLLAGDTIQTLTGALQVGDQWGVPRYRVREYLEAAA